MECKKCAECCSALIPISEYEKNKIVEYCKKNNIVNIKINPLLNNELLRCKFLSNDGKCIIYEVRPELCVHFFCANKEFGSVNFIHPKPLLINEINI